MVTDRGAGSSRPIVVDASAVLAWLVEDAAIAVLERTLMGEGGGPSTRFCAPAHLPIEVSNALIAGERRGRWTAEQADEAMRLYVRWGVGLESALDGIDLGRVMALAREEGLTSYDAAYLELASRTGGSILSFDRALTEAATRRGIEVIA